MKCQQQVLQLQSELGRVQDELHRTSDELQRLQRADLQRAQLQQHSDEMMGELTTANQRIDALSQQLEGLQASAAELTQSSWSSSRVRMRRARKRRRDCSISWR